jgi:hypothetical protein
MPTANSALAKMREICLALPNTTEGEHFGSASFRVRKKMFASCGVKGNVCQVVVQLQADHATQLVESDLRFERYPRAKDCVFIMR